jgi:hypothetical protein
MEGAPLSWRKRALALAWLIDNGRLDDTMPLYRQLVARYGFQERTAYRWVADYRRWCKAGQP